MSDNLALAVLLACALSCSLTVVFFDTFVLPAVKALYRRLTELAHRNRPDSYSAVFGDVVRIPDDFELFHSTCVTEGGQPNNGAR